MTPAPDTLAFILAPQPVLLQYSAESFWQSNFFAGVVGALIGGVLSLVGSALSPFFTGWIAERSQSRHVARRMRRNLQGMRASIGSVRSRLTPGAGLLEHFGPKMLDDLAIDLSKQLHAFHERAYNTIYLKDESVEDHLLAAIKALEDFLGVLQRWAMPIPSARDDIRITDYSRAQADMVRNRCDTEIRRLDAAMRVLAPIERWRWKLPEPVDTPTSGEE